MSKHLLDQRDRDAGTIARWKDYHRLQLVCQECGASFSVPPSVLKKGKGKYCSQKCANRVKGRAMSVERHFKANGYVYIKTWEHPRRSKQNLIAEHRLVVEKAIGRYLEENEVVHHINEITTDNTLFNLFLCKDENEHRIVQRLDKQFLRMFNAARYEHWGGFKNFDIAKDRQDQLQDMVKRGNDKLYPHNLLWRFMRFAMGDAGIKIDGWSEAMQWVTSMEQLWLAFVMKEYNKIWNGEDWIKEV